MGNKTKVFFKNFKFALLLALLGLLIAALLGYLNTGSLDGSFEAILVTTVLCLLEIALSFDNAIVNATILRQMNQVWRRRFLTWGIFIAVFGMRLLLPLILASILLSISPVHALMIAIEDPQKFSAIMHSAHVSISAFGGAYLLMVSLKYFFEKNHSTFWLAKIEKPLSYLGRVESLKVIITLILVYFISLIQNEANKLDFLTAGLWGTITFITVDGIAEFLNAPKSDKTILNATKQNLSLFLYLEMLDASFSFDGVIGAFAITNDLFIIMIGLGIGAIFVRSITVLFVNTGTMKKYPFLKHGAFYAIGAFSIIMFINTILHVSDVITALVGIFFIGAAIISSNRYQRVKSR